MEMNAQAIDLNTVLDQHNPTITRLLSEKGKAAFFPKQGILAQAAEAGSCKINATVGIALEDDGTTAVLPSLEALDALSDPNIFKYAPSAGLPELRKVWKEMLYQKNETLNENHNFSLPVVTNALTHGIFVLGQLFLDEADAILSPEYYWENYDLALSAATKSSLETYVTFTNEGGFNIDGLKEKILAGGVGKKVLILNFPNNPTGYTPTITEAYAIQKMLIEMADLGNELAVILDDAYFGLVFEEGVFEESLFSLLLDAHENILAIKVDGPTKEDYVWGFRTGFITYGIKGGNAEVYGVLEQKTAGIIRGSISNASKVSQTFLLKVYTSPGYAEEKRDKFRLLQERFNTVKGVLMDNVKYGDYFTPVPFNSGYFMCINPRNNVDAEALRQHLIKHHSIGLIQLGGLLRIAFSSTSKLDLIVIFDAIYESCKSLSGRNN